MTKFSALLLSVATLLPFSTLAGSGSQACPKLDGKWMCLLSLSATVGSCKNDELIFNFIGDDGDLYHQTFSRPSQNALRVQIPNVKPTFPLGNNDVTRICELII